MLIDYNSINFDYFIGKQFFLKNSDNPYLIVTDGSGEHYFLDLTCHELYDFYTILEKDGFWRYEDNEDFIGIYEIV